MKVGPAFLVSNMAFLSLGALAFFAGCDEPKKDTTTPTSASASVEAPSPAPSPTMTATAAATTTTAEPAADAKDAGKAPEAKKDDPKKDAPKK